MKIYKIAQYTKSGLPLKFDVKKKHIDGKGFDIYIFTCKINGQGKDVGYLKVGVLQKEKWEEMFGDNVWKFRRKWMGHHEIPDEIINLPTEEQRKKAIIEYIPTIWSWQDPESYYKNEFNKANKRFQFQKEHWVEKPHVDYIQVEEGFRRNHIGIQLYKFAANFLNKKFGYKLYRSDLLSDNAKAFHESETTQKELDMTSEEGGVGYNQDRYFVGV